jgi:hypothetical protein
VWKEDVDQARARPELTPEEEEEEEDMISLMEFTRCLFLEDMGTEAKGDEAEDEEKERCLFSPAKPPRMLPPAPSNIFRFADSTSYDPRFRSKSALRICIALFVPSSYFQPIFSRERQTRCQSENPLDFKCVAARRSI